MNETNAVPLINKLVEWNNIVVGLPSALLIFVGCIALGYAFKVMPFYKNRWIPFGVIVAALIANIAVTPLSGSEKWVRAIFYGLISGVGAWYAHKKYLSKVIDPDVFKNGGDSNPAAFKQPPPDK